MGSQTFKVGTTGHSEPLTFPSVASHPRYTPCFAFGNTADPNPCGEEAIVRRGVLALRWPIRRGRPTNWDQVEKLWKHAFQNVLKIKKAHPVLIVEPLHNTTYCRERMCQVMFEIFNVPRFQLAPPPQGQVYVKPRGADKREGADVYRDI